MKENNNRPEYTKTEVSMGIGVAVVLGLCALGAIGKACDPDLDPSGQSRRKNTNEHSDSIQKDNQGFSGEIYLSEGRVAYIAD